MTSRLKVATASGRMGSMPWRMSRQRPAGRETAKYYIYVSDAKLDLLYGQMPEPFWRRLAAELKVDVKLISLTLRGTEQAPERARYAKLKVVTEYVRRELEVGTVDDPAAYFEGRLPLRWASVFASPEVLFFAGKTERTRLILGGSRRHFLGEPGGSTAFAGSGTGELLAVLSRDVELAPSSEPLVRGVELSNDAALELIGYQTDEMEGPSQQLEFLAKRSLQGRVPRFPEQIMLGTPIYVAQVD